MADGNPESGKHIPNFYKHDKYKIIIIILLHHTVSILVLSFSTILILCKLTFMFNNFENKSD